MSASQPGVDPSRLIALGRIVGVFGIKGWLKVQSYSDPPEALLGYREWRLDRPSGTRRVREGRRQGRLVVASLEGIEDRDAAAQLVGATIVIERGQLPELAPREHYQADLIGLKVIDAAGHELGRVEHFFDAGAHAVMVVKGEREHWLPVTPQHLRRVDLAAGELHVAWDPVED